MRTANARFGFEACYPADLFHPGSQAENGDGLRLEGAPGASALFYAHYAVPGADFADAWRMTMAEAARAGGAAYATRRPDHFVVSWLDRGEVIYVRQVHAGDRVLAFRLRYETADRDRFDPLAGEMAACLRPVP